MTKNTSLNTTNAYYKITDIYTTTNMTLFNCTDNKNNIDKLIPTSLPTIPCGLSFLCLMSWIAYTIFKLLLNKKEMEKFLYPTHPVRCILTGPSECGKSVFLTNLILNIVYEYDKLHIYSHSLHQGLYQKLIKCFSIYIPIHIIPNVLNEEDIDLVIDEIGKNKDFQKSDTEIETYESIEEIKFLQEYNDGGIIILDDSNEKKNDPRLQAMFKRSRHNTLSIFIISQDYFELPKRTIRANGNIYHIFKPKIFRDVQNLYQDEASMDLTLNEFKLLTPTCWNEKYQPLTIEMTKDK